MPDEPPSNRSRPRRRTLNRSIFRKACKLPIPCLSPSQRRGTNTPNQPSDGINKEKDNTLVDSLPIPNPPDDPQTITQIRYEPLNTKFPFFRISAYPFLVLALEDCRGAAPRCALSRQDWGLARELGAREDSSMRRGITPKSPGNNTPSSG